MPHLDTRAPFQRLLAPWTHSLADPRAPEHPVAPQALAVFRVERLRGALRLGAINTHDRFACDSNPARRR